MKNLSTLLMLIALMLLLLTPVVQSQESSPGQLDTKFRIEIIQRSEFPPGLDAEVTTTSVYPCAGYRLGCSTVWNRDTLNIHIGGLVRPTPCIQGMSRATGSTYLGNIGSGSYILRLRYRGETDLYEFVREQSEIQVKPLCVSFSTVRVPQP
jgi:hypothetical protein